MKTIAIIGASVDRSKFGNKAVRVFLRQGYTVYPFNPKEERIEGLPVFKSIPDVPVRPNRPAHVPAPCLMESVPKCQPKRMREIFTH